MTSLRSALAAGCFLLVLFALCEARPTLIHKSANAAKHNVHAAMTAPTATAVVTPHGLSRGCFTSDIKIEQGEVSGVGLPTWQVQILNSCTDPMCSIANVIVNCGLFHTGDILVNPRVFRRLDAKQGTCIVNDGRTIRNADTIIFQYKEIWRQSITFESARISCLV